MALDRYLAVPMLVDLAEPCDDPHIWALTGPKDWRPKLSRKVFHEVLHYWQHIGQGFLIRMVEDDWQRLSAYEADGTLLPPGPLKRGFVERDPVAGFSPRDLMECHARFWDVQAIGPPRLIEDDLDNPDRDSDAILTRAEYDRLKAEGRIWQEIDARGEGRGYSGLSFDLTMRMAGGAYARPYLQLRDATDLYSASVLFPLVAHSAMQSDRPVATFSRLIGRIDALAMPAEPPLIHDAWRRFYPLVVKLALEDAIAETGREFVIGRHVIDQGGLARHPGYHFAAAMMALTAKHLCDRRPDWLLFQDTGMPDQMRADWTLDFLLACCGMAGPGAAMLRELDILSFLAPPWVRFGGVRDWIPAAEIDAVLDQLPVRPEVEGIAGLRHHYPAGLAKIEARWANFQRACFLSSGPASVS